MKSTLRVAFFLKAIYLLINNTEITMKKDLKFGKLLAGLLFDAIGYASFIIPGIGEFSDVIWAPASAYLMTKMYEGRNGKIAGFVSFFEEIVPGLDVIPTFTIMWFYTYVYKNKEKQADDNEIIDLN